METNVNQRLNDIVNYLIFSKVALDKTDLSKKLGYNASSFSQIINERVPLTDRFINRLIEFAPNIDKNWLLTGEGTMLKVPAATMTPIGEQWVEADFKSGDHSLQLRKREDGVVVISHSPEQRSRAAAYARKLQHRGVGVILDPSAPAGVTGTLPKAQPSATPTEAMRDGVNVITDAESVDLSVLPVEVVEELKAEVAKEIEKEIIVPIVPHEIATKTETNIRTYIEDNASELAHFDPRTITAEVDIAETITTTSMSPIYMPNDKVFIKFLKEKTKITDGKIYYFDTRTRPTMVRMVKLLDDGRLLLRAANPRYGDIYLCKEEIINVGEIMSMYRDTFGDQYLEIEAVRRKKDAQTDELIKQNGDALKIVDRLVAVIEKKQ